ncbi:hypothetical protein [Devosia psychrophila]|uniref:Uncharacterized protein n=1 Tax=Devosia psychrophila TaxID=728005 RepID=A0A0F5PZL3_9HYPH|nr:hypothetical protein [Devosia psychrophila]KKC33264.1 hypothetical protein WH91_09500 [Devosia psychrophila]SFC24783.1 hypothetical protein SAMN04488059_103144 [Devosia psychrophila]
MADGLFGTNVAASQLGQAALKPAGIPGSTFIQPRQVETGGNLRALASALGGLNTALQGYGQRQEAKQADPASDMNRDWVARREQMTMGELKEEARLGTPDGIRARQDALDALLGERANDDFRTGWTTFYNTEFEKVGGNMNAEYERMRGEYAAAMPSEISKGNFYRLTGNHFSQWQATDTEQKVGFVKEQIATTVVASFRNASDDMEAAGKTANERAQAIFGASASNRTFLEMSGQEQNDTLYALAAEYAVKGDKDMVRELLQGTRVGANGAPLPSLVSIPKFAVDGLKMVETAQGVWEDNAKANSLEAQVEADALIVSGAFTADEAFKRDGLGIWDDAELANMVQRSTGIRTTEAARFATEDVKRQQRFQSGQAEQRASVETLGMLTRYGGSTRIKDVEIIANEGTGTRTVSSTQLIEQAVVLFETDMTNREAKMVENGTDPARAASYIRGKKLAFYAGNKLPNTEWADTFNGLAMRATVETLVERGDVQQQMLDSAELYREIATANPAYASTLLTDPKSKEFLEVYALGVTNRRMPPADALHFAAQRVAMPETERARNLLNADTTQEIARDVLRGLNMDDDRGSNYGYVVSRIQDMALGSSNEREIRDQIKAEIENTSVEINGLLVPDHADLPQDFPVLMDAELKAAFDTFKDAYGLESPDDLSIRPAGPNQNKWFVINKATGLPVRSGYVTPQSLNVHRTQAARAHDAMVLEMVQGKDADRVAGQARYDASIADMEANIAKFRGRSGKMSPGIADYLQGVLDDRLERDELLRNMTPEKVQEELARVRAAAEERDLNGNVGWSPIAAPPM